MPDMTPAKPDVRQAILDNLDALWAKSPPKLKPLLATTLRAAQVATHLPTGHCLQLKPEACSALMDFLYAACPPLETMDLGVVQATPTAAAETPAPSPAPDLLAEVERVIMDEPVDCFRGYRERLLAALRTLPALRDAAAAAGEVARLRAVLSDDGFASDVARKCNDPQHDVRWCPTCSAREDGIEAYREAVARATQETR
jgi:hypothetical protein